MNSPSENNAQDNTMEQIILMRIKLQYLIVLIIDNYEKRKKF